MPLIGPSRRVPGSSGANRMILPAPRRHLRTRYGQRPPGVLARYRASATSRQERPVSRLPCGSNPRGAIWVLLQALRDSPARRSSSPRVGAGVTRRSTPPVIRADSFAMPAGDGRRGQKCLSPGGCHLTLHRLLGQHRRDLLLHGSVAKLKINRFRKCRGSQAAPEVRRERIARLTRATSSWVFQSVHCPSPHRVRGRSGTNKFLAPASRDFRKPGVAYTENHHWPLLSVFGEALVFYLC